MEFHIVIQFQTELSILAYIGVARILFEVHFFPEKVDDLF